MASAAAFLRSRKYKLSSRLRLLMNSISLKVKAAGARIAKFGRRLRTAIIPKTERLYTRAAAKPTL